MGKEIIINAEKERTRIAICENGELVELYIESPDNARTLGDIYLARVRKIMPSIQAAFVDIGQKQDAFLHFSDLTENLPQLLDFVNEENPHVGGDSGAGEQPHKTRGKRRKPKGGKGSQDKDSAEGESNADGGENKRRGKSGAQARGRRRHAQRRSKRGGRNSDGPRPETYLKRDQRILVKIVKEPISSKGSRVSTDISMAGRFLVLVPFANYVAVSKKIYSYKERRRLRALAKSLLPDGFGLIIRTAAEGKNAKTLDTDLNLLLEKWRKLEKQLAGKPKPPISVHQDVNMVSSVMRDLFSDDYDRVLIDEPKLYRNIKSYIQAVAPQMVDAVRPHKSKKHIFEQTGIQGEIEQAFSGRVDLPTGGYLFIEHTEAMHVVDVNSGRSGRGMSQEENSLRVNLEAARAIARQVRLRDLGGILVVDFIDLRDERNKRKVYDEMKKEFKKDRAVSKILPMSDFGLVQITRQRLRPSITVGQTPDFLPRNGSTSKSEAPDRPQREQKDESIKEASSSRSEDAPTKGMTNDGSAKENGDRDKELDGRDAESKKRASRPSPTRSVDPEKFLARMEQWLVDYKTMGNRRAVTLRVHPFTAAYLNRKVPNHPTRWFMKHLIRVRLEIDDTVSPHSYRFIDARSGEDMTDKIELPASE